MAGQSPGAGVRKRVVLLLTGGGSRRMGADKARIVRPDGLAQAVWLRQLLQQVGLHVVEVGSGVSGAPCVEDCRLGPHRGVLEAVEALALGPSAAVTWVGVDRYQASPGALAWLVREVDEGPAVAIIDGRPVWDLAGGWVATLAVGARRLSELLPRARFVHVPTPLQGPLTDADDPDALVEQFGSEWGSRVRSGGPHVEQEPVDEQAEQRKAR